MVISHVFLVIMCAEHIDDVLSSISPTRVVRLLQLMSLP